MVYEWKDTDTVEKSEENLETGKGGRPKESERLGYEVKKASARELTSREQGIHRGRSRILGKYQTGYGKEYI